ncbi:MAG: acyltransferase [Symploca sp. SIO1B1]|nr:acyltransferase [Symploca sp. SIO1B1]
MSLSNNSDLTKERIFPLDLLKALSIVAVVSFHGTLVPQQSYVNLEPTLNILFAPLRFCVPVFLTISFFLGEQSLQRQPEATHYDWLKKRLTRLAIPTCFWFSIAAVLVLIKEEFLGKPITTTLQEICQLVLTGRIFAGAYYLLVILQLSLLLIYLHRYFYQWRNLLFVILLQGFAFIAIDASLQGNFATQFSDFLRLVQRPFIIYWFVYLALGIYLYTNWQVLRQISTGVHTSVKIILLLLTSLAMIAEASWLHHLTGRELLPFEYAMLSCIISAGIWFLALATVEEKQLPSRLLPMVRLLSKYSLGIFCLNGILVHIFVAFSSLILPDLTYNLPQILVIKILGTVLLLSVSLGMSIVLEKLGLGRCVC